VTSCSAGEGVTTVAANLAVYVSFHTRQPVLLVDANLERPAIHRPFGVKVTPGLVDVLRDDVPLDDAVQPTKYGNLWVLAAGATKAAIAGQRTAPLSTLFDKLDDSYGHVIFDLAVAGEVGPCFPLARLLDGVLLVVESEHVRRPAAEWVQQRLQRAGANVVGAVLNKRRHYVPSWLYRRL
jgi:Mrp family chromosome partitioning ATPase